MTKWGGVKREEERSKYRALWNSSMHRRWGSRVRTNTDTLGPVFEVGCKEAKSRSGDAKGRGESREKNIMINSVEGSRKVKKNKSREFATVYC
jgi:hypothetical protein